MRTHHQALPSLSVIVPVFNEESQLEDCVSLLVASRDIEEIVLIDNNSSDRSAKVMRRLERAHPDRIKLAKETVQGVAPTRNTGFRLASGDIIARVDADARIQDGWARAVKRFFRDNPDADAVYGTISYYDLPLPSFSASLGRFFILASNRFASGSPSLCGLNTAFRAKIARELADVACSKAPLMEDLDLTIHLRDNHRQIAACEGMLVAASGRRMLVNPLQFWKYNQMNTTAYAMHGKYVSAAIMQVVVVLGCIGHALVFLPLRAYDPVRRKFSFGNLKRPHEERALP